MPVVLGKRKRQSSKPERPKSERDRETASAIREFGVLAMVSCTQCINAGVECYYDREQSVKCAECLLHQRKCDGTFSLQEFRKVGEQKKLVKEKSREKRRQIMKLRKALVEAQKALAAAESEEVDIEEDLSRLDEISSRMLKREMMALGAFDQLSDVQEIAIADDAFSDWPSIPAAGPVDWEEMLVLQESLVPGH